jgi:hypothetical protein
MHPAPWNQVSPQVSSQGLRPTKSHENVLMSNFQGALHEDVFDPVSSRGI